MKYLLALTILAMGAVAWADRKDDNYILKLDTYTNVELAIDHAYREETATRYQVKESSK